MQILSLILITLVALFPGRPEMKKFLISGYTQGTTYQITFYATDSIVKQSEVENILSRVDSSLSIYKPYSLINSFNSSKRGVKMDVFLADVVRKSIDIYTKTDGKFDITVYPLVNAWGFGTKKVTSLPDSAAIQQIMPCVGSEKLRIVGDSLIKAKPCVKIDVNGIAQGYTVDLLASFLEKKKIATYLVEIGGEIRIKGRKPNGQLMQVGIESPSENSFAEPVIQTAIPIKKGAVTTSGNYRKFVRSGNKKVSHLINPKTGFYLESEVISATVIAADAITADGYDNALIAMKPADAITFANKTRNLEAYIIYQKKDGTVADTASKGFYKLIRKKN